MTNKGKTIKWLVEHERALLACQIHDRLYKRRNEICQTCFSVQSQEYILYKDYITYIYV
jgi:hypothetical protein